MRPAGFLLVATVGVGLFANCSTDEALAPSVEAFCRGVCQNAAFCNPAVMFESCTAGCRDETAADLARIRPEFAAAFGRCMSQANCNTSPGATTELCWGRAGEEIEPSARLRSFCPTYATSLFECGVTYAVEDCLSELSLWTDEVLNLLATCGSAPTCDAEWACEEQVFGTN